MVLKFVDIGIVSILDLRQLGRETDFGTQKNKIMYMT